MAGIKEGKARISNRLGLDELRCRLGTRDPGSDLTSEANPRAASPRGAQEYPGEDLLYNFEVDAGTRTWLSCPFLGVPRLVRW